MHFDLWETEIDPVLQKSINPPHPAIDIWHPDCVSMNVKSIVVEEVSQFVEIKDAWEVTLNVIEYREPKPDYGTPKGSSSKSGNAETKEDKSSEELKKQKSQAAYKEDQIAQRKARRQK